MNIAVVDDNADDLRRAKNFIGNYITKNFPETSQGTRIEIFDDSEKFLGQFEPNKYDLLVLDIFMKPINGIQVAQIIRSRDSDVSIIFLTNSEEYILDGYKVFAIGYFIKPLDENAEQFAKTFEHVFPQLQQRKKKILVHVRGGDEIFVVCKNINYVDIDEHHHVSIHLTDGIISASETYEDILAELREDPRFLECYHRILVNMDFIGYMDGEDFVLKDGTKIPISRRKNKEVKLKYMTYLMGFNSANTL